jgi:hypothetical protein
MVVPPAVLPLNNPPPMSDISKLVAGNEHNITPSIPRLRETIDQAASIGPSIGIH